MLTFEAPNMCRLVSRVEGFVADTALLQDNDVVVVPVEKLAAIVVKSMMVDSGDRGMEYVESGKEDEQIMMGCDYSEYENLRRAAVACATRTFR
jgi:hypothetical protein